jgi:hypothetical protein
MQGKEPPIHSVTNANQIVAKRFHRSCSCPWLYGLGVVGDEDCLLSLDDDDSLPSLWRL